MELDKRIKALTDIITCFKEDRSRAEKCIGQNGYFADDMMNFNNLEGCIYGKLENYVIDEDYPFKCMPADIHYAFFIPESVLKPKEKEKQYRPYTIEEFCDEGFEIVVFRGKDNKSLEYHVRYNGYLKGENNYLYIILGNATYTLSHLFKYYEYLDDDGVWKPFGVEE